MTQRPEPKRVPAFFITSQAQGLIDNEQTIRLFMALTLLDKNIPIPTQ